MLWLASPLVLGIGHLDGTDVPFALGVTLSSWALLRWLRRRDTRTLTWLGLGLAAAAETQVTGLLVVAAALAVVVAAEWRSGVARALARAGLAGLIAWAVVWAVYIAVDPAMVWQVPMLVPRPYLDGIGYLDAHDTTGSAAYVAGIAYTGGRWWFWPLSLVIKWPQTALPLLVAGAIGCLRLPRALRRRARVAVGLPAVLLTAFTLAMPKDVGVRYLLPAPALWAGGAACGIVAVLGTVNGAARKRAAGAAVAVLLGNGGARRRQARSRDPSRGRPGRSGRATRWRPIPTWTGGRAFTRCAPGARAGIRGWLISGPAASSRPTSPAPGRFSAPRRLAWTAGSPPR